MKLHVFPLLTLLVVMFMSTIASAQFITKRSGKFGLVDTEGQVLILNQCDTIYQVRNEFRVLPAFIARSENQYGVFILGVSEEIEFPYDELTNEGGYCFFRQGEKWGFLAEGIDRSIRAVEPQFDEVYPIAERIGGFKPSEADLHYLSKRVGIVQNGMHGMASYESGEIIRPCQFPGKIDLVKGTSSSDYYKSVDHSLATPQKTILSDISEVDFVVPVDTDIEIRKEQGIIVMVSPVNNDSLFSIHVANILTGESIIQLVKKWDSTQDYLSEFHWKLLNDEVLVIYEEHMLDDAKNTQLRNITCYNFKSGTLLYESGMGQFTRLTSRKLDDGKSLLYIHPMNKKYAQKNETAVAKLDNDTKEIEWLK